MMSLARRLRRRFPSLLDRPYFPKRYPIISTQVRRSSHSRGSARCSNHPGMTSVPQALQRSSCG
jgi:hypothetical protein